MDVVLKVGSRESGEMYRQKRALFQVNKSQATKHKNNSKCVANTAVCPLTIKAYTFSLDVNS